MKRDAINHTKLKKLSRLLDVPAYQAVGILESLWHLTGREAIRGDIGKLTDQDIAYAIDYRGDETQLIESLVRCRWLDRHKRFRLLVHDWNEHADDTIKKRIQRSGIGFCTPETADNGGQRRTTADGGSR